MRTIKALFTAVAVGAVSVVLAASAMAAEPTVLDAKTAYDSTTGVIDATDNYSTTDGQMTAVVVEAAKWDAIGKEDGADLTADDLLYINQFDTDDAAATLGNIGLKGLLTKDVKYYVLLGGDNASEIQMLSITYTEEGPVYKWGDVNEDGNVNDTDSLLLLRHTIPLEEITSMTEEKLVAICDINKDGIVNDTDSLLLLRHTIPLEEIPGM